MKTRKPLTDEEGEVRELLMDDIRRFRPMAEGLSPSLAAKLGVTATPRRRSEVGSGKGGLRAMGKLEAIYRALFDLPLADDAEVAKLADQYAGDEVSAKVVSNRRGEIRWVLRELHRRGWLSPTAEEQVKPLLES